MDIRKVLNANETEKGKLYLNSQNYWSKISPTIDGMLGGFGDLNVIDINGSLKFLEELFKICPFVKRKYALDCGAGIGRITKNLLLPIFECVDVVEQDKTFSESIKSYIDDNFKLKMIYNKGLQDFIPEEKKYDIVWCQWVLGYLIDDDLLDFFKRVSNALTEHGILVIKENVTSSQVEEFDEIDSSVTRPIKSFKKLLKLAKFKIIRSFQQTNFENGLYPVYMIACRPRI